MFVEAVLSQSLKNELAESRRFSGMMVVPSVYMEAVSRANASDLD
jgi:hypothetical protein